MAGSLDKNRKRLEEEFRANANKAGLKGDDSFRTRQEKNTDAAKRVISNRKNQTTGTNASKQAEKKQTNKPATQLPAQLRPVHLMGNPTQSTAQTNSNTKKTKDIGQNRNQDKSGWTNPNGQKKSNNTVKNVNNKKLGKSSITTGTLSKKKAGKVTTTQARLKKAWNAVDAMKERRAKAMANRDPSKNPNNVNLRGIVKTKKKGKKG